MQKELILFGLQNEILTFVKKTNMNLYNKIMLNFWLAVGVVLLVFVSYKSFTDGFNKWGYYYVFAGLALLMYFMRRIMLKRMEKHMKYLEEQENAENK